MRGRNMQSAGSGVRLLLQVVTLERPSRYAPAGWEFESLRARQLQHCLFLVAASPPRRVAIFGCGFAGQRFAHHAARPTAYRDLYLRSEEHTSELQSRRDLVCRLLLEKKK